MLLTECYVYGVGVHLLNNMQNYSKSCKESRIKKSWREREREG